MTCRLGTSSSSCFGALKSFFATRTPSIGFFKKKLSKKMKKQKVVREHPTLEEVFVDDAPVLFRDDHGLWITVLFLFLIDAES